MRYVRNGISLKSGTGLWCGSMVYMVVVSLKGIHLVVEEKS